MRTLRILVAISAALAAALGWAGGVAILSQRAEASVAPATLDSIVRATLDEETADGFNPVTNGLYINWSMVDPSQVNFTDHDTTRHDALTDLRDLDGMERYEQLHPGDTSQQAGIARMYPVAISEFRGTSSNVGWVYWELLDIAAVTHDSAWTADAASMAQAFSAAIDPTTGVVHEHLTDNGNNCTDGYRVDATLERALMLVDAGKRFANTTWSQQGHRAYSVVRTVGLDPAYGLYAREVCKGSVSDHQAKTEEQADEARDSILAGEAVGDSGLIGDGIALLDALVGNSTGLHDTVDGGWCPLFDMGKKALHCGTKLSRQYLLLRTFHDADQLDPGRYAAEETELLNLVPRMVTSPHVGFLYERSRDFSLHNGENWITSEADGIVVDALEHVLADQSTTTTSSTTTTTSSSSTTTTTTTSTTTTRTSSTTTSSTTSANCPGQTRTTTGTVSGSSQSIFVTASGGALCATLTWSGGAVLDLIVYDNAGTIVLGQVTTGVSPELLRIATRAGTVYKVKVKPVSGSAAYTLTTAA